MCLLFITAVLIIFILIIGLHAKTTNAICYSKKKLEGKTVLVTGGTAGMGLEIAKDLAHRGARVIVACPFIEEGNAAVKQIKEETENDDILFKLLDLASLKSIRIFASEILATEKRIDILVNNAGVGMVCNALTAYGMQFIMQINYYGAFLLTILLLPLLIKTGKNEEPSRIIMTSSVLHHVGRVDFENLNKLNYYFFKTSIYSNSKLCVSLFVNEFAKRLINRRITNVVVNCVDPGPTGTRIFVCFGVILGFIIQNVLYTFSKTPWEGAQTALFVALDKKTGQVSGRFFKNCKEIKAANRTYCEKTCKILWEESIKLVHLNDVELENCFKVSKEVFNDLPII